jgi:DnaK suppressor protein
MARKVTTSSTSKNPVKTATKAAKAPSKTAAAAKPHPAPTAKPAPVAKAPAPSPSKEVIPAKAAPAKAAPAKAPAKAATATKAKPRGDRVAFLAVQRQLLLDERANYLRSADTLKAQADSLALEHEPGDVQFDEEGGEGGTSNVDRELDLVLSAQARAAAVEIDRALGKIQAGTYGLCEQCAQPIPDARLQALPQASLCVACKSGGLSSRR